MKKLYVNDKLVAMGDYTIREVSEEPKYTVRVVPDYNYRLQPEEYPEVKVYSNHRHYRFDDSIENLPSTEERSSNYKYYPIYMLEHSGVALSRTPFNDPWDSGLLGVAEVDDSNGEADSIFKAYFTELKASFEGEVYGFQVLDELGEIVDSCYGFYGEDIVQAMLYNIPSEYNITKEDITKATEA